MIQFLLPGFNLPQDAKEYLVNNLDQYSDKCVLLSSSEAINCIASVMLAPIAKALFVRGNDGFICVASRSDFKIGLTYDVVL